MSNQHINVLSKLSEDFWEDVGCSAQEGGGPINTEIGCTLNAAVAALEELDQLRAQLQAASERIERLERYLSKFGDVWVDYQNEELEKEP